MDFGVARSTESPRRPAAAGPSGAGVTTGDPTLASSRRPTGRRTPSPHTHGRPHRRHHRVHGPGAVARGSRRSARRHLRVRTDPLRPAAGPHARRARAQRGRGAAAADARGATAAARHRPVDPGGGRADRHAVRAARSRRPVCHVARPRGGAGQARCATAYRCRCRSCVDSPGRQATAAAWPWRRCSAPRGGSRAGRRARQARAGLDPDYGPPEPHRRPGVRRHARADAEAGARGRGLHQRLRPQRHPPQPGRDATRQDSTRRPAARSPSSRVSAWC